MCGKDVLDKSKFIGVTIKMVDREKIKSYKNIIFVGTFAFSILVNGGFFPIINFNSINPVDLGIMLRWTIIAMAFIFHKSIGSLEAIILSKWSVTLISIFNVFLVLCGLICRYLLEFGEISNTYNFTILNVLFQVIVLSFVSTAVCLLERKKN